MSTFKDRSESLLASPSQWPGNTHPIRHGNRLVKGKSLHCVFCGCSSPFGLVLLSRLWNSIAGCAHDVEVNTVFDSLYPIKLKSSEGLQNHKAGSQRNSNTATALTHCTMRNESHEEKQSPRGLPLKSTLSTAADI